MTPSPRRKASAPLDPTAAGSPARRCVESARGSFEVGAGAAGASPGAGGAWTLRAKTTRRWDAENLGVQVVSTSEGLWVSFSTQTS
jgi:hypothetical protein